MSPLSFLLPYISNCTHSHHIYISHISSHWNITSHIQKALYRYLYMYMIGINELNLFWLLKRFTIEFNMIIKKYMSYKSYYQAYTNPYLSPKDKCIYIYIQGLHKILSQNPFENESQGFSCGWHQEFLDIEFINAWKTNSQKKYTQISIFGYLWAMGPSGIHQATSIHPPTHASLLILFVSLLSFCPTPSTQKHHNFYIIYEG